MSSAEVIDFFSPARERVDAVVEWLTASGIGMDRITESANKQVGQGRSADVPSFPF